MQSVINEGGDLRSHFSSPRPVYLASPLAVEGPTGHLDFYSDDLGELKGIICSVVRQIFAVSSGMDKKTQMHIFQRPTLYVLFGIVSPFGFFSVSIFLKTKWWKEPRGAQVQTHCFVQREARDYREGSLSSAALSHFYIGYN